MSFLFGFSYGIVIFFFIIHEREVGLKIVVGGGLSIKYHSMQKWLHSAVGEK